MAGAAAVEGVLVVAVAVAVAAAVAVAVAAVVAVAVADFYIFVVWSMNTTYSIQEHPRLARGDHGLFSSVLIALLRCSCFGFASLNESMVLLSTAVLLAETVNLRSEFGQELASKPIKPKNTFSVKL